MLLHDGLLDCRIWDEQFGVLSECYGTVRYDRRGYGRSEPSSGEFSQVGDLRTLLGALSVKQAHLIGASSGGGIAVDFALKYPESVRSLVLAGPSLSGYRDSEEKQRRIADIFSAARREGIFGWREMWLDYPSWAPDVKHTSARRKIEKLLVTAFHNCFDNPRSRARREPPALGRLSEIRVPALVVVGERDDLDNHAMRRSG
ncbi:MAG: alpha/beta hydrolase [Actinomycetota bacterium]|nr:alpha/beta hydrolase [Actinomycetota bacterium]